MMKYFKFYRFFGTIFGALFLLGNAANAMEGPPTIAPPSDLIKMNNPCEICGKSEAKIRVLDDKYFCDPKKVCGPGCAENFIKDCRKKFRDPEDFKIYFNGLYGKSECVICGDDSSFKNISFIAPCGHQYMCSECWVVGEKKYICPICQREIVNNLNGPAVWRLVSLDFIKKDNKTALEVYKSCKVAQVREKLIKNADKIVIDPKHLTNKTVEHKIADLAYSVCELQDKPIEYLDNIFKMGFKLHYVVSGDMALTFGA